MPSRDREWPLLLRTGYGNVFKMGRWDHASTVLIAAAINSGRWSSVEDWANEADWDDTTAN